MTGHIPSSDASFAQLHRAGWPVGDVAAHTNSGQVWIVTGTNGENRIEARAVLQAEIVWMAGPFVSGRRGCGAK